MIFPAGSRRLVNPNSPSRSRSWIPTATRWKAFASVFSYLRSNMAKIEDYAPIVGQPAIDDLFLLASHLRGKSVQNINSTAVGGGVAEILTRMIPLLKELGVDARWDVIKGNEKFFAVTKKFHNGLHGVPVEVSD